VANGQFGKNSKRRTFTDEVQKNAKSIPGCANYKPYELPKNSNVPLGKISKADGVDFLSEV